MWQEQARGTPGLSGLEDASREGPRLAPFCASRGAEWFTGAKRQALGISGETARDELQGDSIVDGKLRIQTDLEARLGSACSELCKPLSGVHP